MSCTLNREAYRRLIQDDIDWINTIPRTLERDHVLAVLEWAKENRIDGEDQPAKFPCQFDSNGECLVCDCWPSDCPFKKTAVRLKAFEDVAEALWPFVRAFGLCGAHPTAIAAVVAMGKLLGHTDASQSTVLEIGDKVRSETVHEIADKVEELLRGKVLAREIPQIIDEVRKL